jgi:hypothetical protein
LGIEGGDDVVILVVNFILALLAFGVSIWRWLKARRQLKLKALPANIEHFVLYLRPFWPEKRHYISLLESAEDYERRIQWKSTLDEFLAREAAKRIGPVVGLGRPGDREPRPGAYRIYLDQNDDWQSELGRLADKATAIVMVPGRTASVKWELEYIAEKKLWSKLFIVTRRPVKPGSSIAWSAFARDLNAIGLRAGDDPGLDVIVGFSPDRSSRVIGSAATATSVVNAIKEWLPEHGAEYERIASDDTHRTKVLAAEVKPAEVKPAEEAEDEVPGSGVMKSATRSTSGELIGFTIHRPQGPFDRVDIPVLVLGGVPVIVWAITEWIEKGGIGTTLAAGFVMLLFGPFVAGFLVLLFGYLWVPNIDSLVRHDKVRRLVRALWHRRFAVRQRAQNALAERTDVQTAITLIESTDEKNFDHALYAATQILEAAGDAAIEPLARAMDGASERRHIIYLLAMVGNQEMTMAVLVKALRSESAGTRILVSVTLRDRLADDALPATIREATTDRLLKMLRDEPDFRVRRAVVNALEAADTELVTSALAGTAEKDPDDKVRADAVAALLSSRDADPDRASLTTGAESPDEHGSR